MVNVVRPNWPAIKLYADLDTKLVKDMLKPRQVIREYILMLNVETLCPKTLRATCTVPGS